MSIEAMAWAWDQPVRGTQKLVLLALGDWANADDEAWPHIATLARRVGVKERAIQDALAELEGLGLLRRSSQYRDDGGQRGNLFTIPLRNAAPPPCSTPQGKNPHEEPPGEKKGSTDPKESDDVREVWEHYVTVFKAERQTLDSTRRTLIKNALKVRSVAECKRAIDGLHASPFHNGENDRQTKYLDIRYALKGNSQRGESNQDRIDKMGELAPAHGLAPGLERKVAIRLDNYRRFLASGKTRETRRSLESKAELEEMGFAVIDLEGPPWVRLEKAE